MAQLPATLQVSDGIWRDPPNEHYYTFVVQQYSFISTSKGQGRSQVKQHAYSGYRMPTGHQAELFIKGLKIQQFTRSDLS